MSNSAAFALDFENLQVVRLVQAMLGALTPNFKGVYISFGDGVVLRFVLREESAEDREEIDDIVFEFQALQDGFIDVECEVIVTDRAPHELVLPGRPVFLAKI